MSMHVRLILLFRLSITMLIQSNSYSQCQQSSSSTNKLITTTCHVSTNFPLAICCTFLDATDTCMSVEKQFILSHNSRKPHSVSMV